MLHRAVSRLRRSAPAAPPRAETDAVVVLERASWARAGTIAVRGWAYVEGADALAVDSLLAVGAGGEVVATAAVTRVHDEIADLHPGDKRSSHANAVFEAELDLGTWRRGRIVVDVVAREGGRLVRRPFATRPPGAPARHLRASGVAEGSNTRLTWSKTDGLVLVRASVTAALARVEGDAGALVVEVEARSADGLALLGEAPGSVLRRIESVVEKGVVRARITVEEAPSARQVLVATLPDGSTARVLRRAEQRAAAIADGGLRVASRASGVTEIRCGAVLAVSELDVTASRVTIVGRVEGLPADAVLEVRGPRGRVQVDLAARSGETVLTIPTSVCGWLGTNIPLPAGRYQLWVVSGKEEVPVELAEDLLEPVGVWAGSDVLRVRVLRGQGDRMLIESAAPLADDERSDRAQAVLEHRYATSTSQPRRLAYFECYYGTSATDSARAIHDELRRRGSDLELVWGVADLSVAVPEGGRGVLRGSREWWEVLAQARFLTFNAGLPYGLRRRSGQTVVQTWHGTPFKRLGSDRPGFGQDRQGSAATAASVARWDALLAGNPHSADVFGRVWGYDGPIVQLGYPRNDALAGADAAEVARVRRALGIEDDRLVVLYVPTWRDGNRVMDQFLDTDEVVRGLGRKVTVLVRGHMNISGWATRIGGRDVLDVTGYPEINDLFLAADVAVTDYSSIMFDYSVTGKPLVFLAPDLDDYRDRRRGTYLDLEESGPGPVVRSTAAVVRVLRDLETTQTQFAARYAAWRAAYNPLDDGRAAARVVDALYDER
ncbi:CDP-glycerol glycerophosphotransferase family protein [Mumia sp. zg.B53]|uniref:CDP-glycerol glycerophosphotransferase family protein n=1 Tax=Mumia sp. zg.B53 TaxID=2855449 RepID=UPI001C6E91BA|nr:CDP-glycerol glycerophosphotransferase family protein [Mumia sp. zg.B53]MBW9214121.1 CDP-glycerol glycerophosphotransferase family protein [Mumia sp. zg.B53]